MILLGPFNPGGQVKTQRTPPTRGGPCLTSELHCAEETEGRFFLFRVQVSRSPESWVKYSPKCKLSWRLFEKCSISLTFW